MPASTNGCFSTCYFTWLKIKYPSKVRYLLLNPEIILQPFVLNIKQ
jgi:hypothetical protein